MHFPGSISHLAVPVHSSDRKDHTEMGNQYIAERFHTSTIP
jgi:hypothetical protein